MMGRIPQSLIAEVMPRYSLRQVDHVAIAAKPSTAYTHARNVDMYRIRFVRRLFHLRILPERIAAWAKREPYEPKLSSRIDDIASAGSGFLLLREEPGREVVVGSIGKFWQLAIEFAPITADQFATFDQPGYGKLAWCIRVDPRSSGGSWLTVELRVGATDAASLARFKRYWWVIGWFSHAIRHGVLRMLANELGAAPADSSRPLPGDELLPDFRFQRTHAAVIEAPVATFGLGWFRSELDALAGTASISSTMPACPAQTRSSRSFSPCRSATSFRRSPRVPRGSPY
jgi:hypothetical protein